MKSNEYGFTISNKILVKILRDMQNFSLLGLDIGMRKSGVAFYSRSINLTLPIGTVRSSKNLVETIVGIIRERQIFALIVGFPFYKENLFGDIVQLIFVTIKEIKEEIPNILITLFDERFTTAMANRLLKETGYNRRQRSTIDDEVAAAILLDGFVRKVFA